MAAALGWLHRSGVLHLPDGLDALVTVGGRHRRTALYVVEFVADKIPAFDSIWDGMHTFVRIPAAALLAFAALGDAPETWRVVAGLLSGGVALSVHGLKASTRLAANTSPEPFSNWGLSLGEDLSVRRPALSPGRAPADQQSGSRRGPSWSAASRSPGSYDRCADSGADASRPESIQSGSAAPPKTAGSTLFTLIDTGPGGTAR